MLLIWTFSILLLIERGYSFNIDSIQQWNDTQLVCGYPVHILQPHQWAEILDEQITIQTTNHSIALNNQTQKIIVSYEDFLCCLKNVWISIKNNMQKQKCLKYFMKCIKSTQHQGCHIAWTYYVNLAVHDLRVATMLVVTSAIFFVTSVILVEKCKEDGYDSFVDNGTL